MREVALPRARLRRSAALFAHARARPVGGVLWLGAFWWGCPVSQRSILFWMPQTASLKLCERHASKTSMSDPGPAAVRTHGAAIPAGTDGLVRHFSKPSPSFSLAPGSGLCAAASLLRHRRAGCALRRSTLRDCWRRARWGIEFRVQGAGCRMQVQGELVMLKVCVEW